MSTGADPHTGLDSELTEALLRTRRFFTRADISDDPRTVTRRGGRQGDVFYRDRWSHDKVVRFPRRELNGVVLVEGLRQRTAAKDELVGSHPRRRGW